MDTKEFLTEIYRGCDEGYITLTLLPERRTLWFKLGEFDKLEQAVKKYSNKTNIYFGVGLRKKILPNNLRGKNNDISTVTALYADIDIKSKAHAQTALPSSVNEAMEFLNSIPLTPSILVNSGNGLHAYWLLDEPFKIKNLKEKDYISSIFKGWSKVLSAKAFELDWKLDNVSDLARVLRVPGSINHKLENRAICEVLDSNGIRYHLTDFEPYMVPFEPNNKKAYWKNFQTGETNRIIEKCDFIKYCKENAKELTEPYWHAMITNLAPTKDGIKAIYELSKPYPKYDKTETDRKIQHAVNENKPHTCKYIQEHLGFECSKDCKVKSPVVLGTPSKEQSFMDLIENTLIDADKIFLKDNIKLCAFAKGSMPAEYARLKTKLKGKVSLRDFEKAVKYETKKSVTNCNDEKPNPLDLKGIKLNGAVTPHGWNVSMTQGIQKVSVCKDSSIVTSVCKSPVVITKRLENFDDGSEKIELSFFRDGRWKRLIAPRSSVFNRNSIIKYADSGLPISSSSAAELVAYLSDYENANIDKIPLVRSIARVGWVLRDRTGRNANALDRNKMDFFPYCSQKEIIFESESSEVNGIIDAVIPHGNMDIWKKYAAKARENPFARFILSASFASPLLKLLDNRVFFIHIWHDSQSGKTAAIKFAISVWGDASKLMGSFNATSVGLERMAGILKHLPFAIDELQVLNDRRLSVEKIVYSLGNGYGRVRGNKNGGMQNIPTWQNIMITSGEQPISNESSNDGAITRVLELYGRPVDDVDFAHDLHIVSATHYGLAGEQFIKYIIKNVDERCAKQLYGQISKEIAKKCTFEAPKAQIDNVSLVCLGDYYSSIAIFNTEKNRAWDEAVNLGTKILQNCKELQKSDTIDRAWDFVTDWITSNKNRFSPDSTPCYGKIEQNKVYIIPNILRQALLENGFDYSKITRGFKDKGFVTTQTDSNGHERMQVQKKINGFNKRCFCIEGDFGGDF